MLGPPIVQLIDSQMKLRGAKIPPQKWVYPQDSMSEKNSEFYWFISLFCLFGLEQRRQFLMCSKMMSRNSIRQNQIELIYRVNSESFNMTKVWTLLLLKHKLLVNRRGALLTLRWKSVSKMTRWKGSYCNTPVVSMINIFLSAPVTILPLKKNVTEVISQIQSFYWLT